MSNTVWKWNSNKQIGESGGFGAVYECKKAAGDAVESGYAMKRLTKLDSDSIGRFQREIRILKRLKHPRVIKVEGYKLEEEPYFYTMKKYQNSLHAVIAGLVGNHSRIRIIFNAIFDGVEYLHNEGIYHRDLKPENILYNSDTDLVISDFGLQLNINSESTRLTLTGVGIGTEWYCSPEQIMDFKNVDHRTDIYALGKMIYECYIGTRDYVLDFHKLPSGIRSVVEYCTKNNPNERYQNIEELRQAFNSSIDILVGNVPIDDVTSIINKIKSSNATDNLINKLIQSLNAQGNLDKQLDTVHEIIMDLPVKAFKLLLQIDFTLAKDIISVYVHNVTSQSWGFSYTDNIGDRCKEIYHIVQDFDIHADLLYAVIQVGVYHNRWHVMEIARDLAYSVKDCTEAIVICRKIKPLDYEIGNLELEPLKLCGPLKELVNNIKSKEESDDGIGQ